MKKKVLSIVLAGALVAGTVVPTMVYATDEPSNKPVQSEETTKEVPKYEVLRMKGTNRYFTAIEASKKTFKEVEAVKYVAVATGEEFVDGLVGGSLTAQGEFPLLLTKKDTILDETLAEIERIQPEEVFILGGEAAVSKKVEEKIQEKIGEEVKITRLAGKTRFETAEAIGLKRAQLLDPEVKKLDENKHLINASNFADALSAAPFLATGAANEKDTYPLIPFNGDDDQKGINYVFGGKAVVSASGKARLSGSNRYETATVVANAYKSVLGVEIDTIVLVSGEEFPDGLTSASVAKMNNAAILLTGSEELPIVVKQYLSLNENIKNIIIVGGEKAVSSEIEKALKDLTAKEEVDVETTDSKEEDGSTDATTGEVGSGGETGNETVSTNSGA